MSFLCSFQELLDSFFTSLPGLNFFRLNDYSIQLVFFLISINLQISVAFLASAMFSDVKTATGTVYIILVLIQDWVSDEHKMF